MKSQRKLIDQRPGTVPEIRAEGDSVIYCLSVLAERAFLVIRCNPDVDFDSIANPVVGRFDGMRLASAASTGIWTSNTAAVVACHRTASARRN